MTNANMPEAPAEVLEVPHGLLSRTTESDADQLAHAVGASLDHLRRWLTWAAEEAADVQAQRSRSREPKHTGRTVPNTRVQTWAMERPDQTGRINRRCIAVRADLLLRRSSRLPPLPALSQVGRCVSRSASGRESSWVTAAPGGWLCQPAPVRRIGGYSCAAGPLR